MPGKYFPLEGYLRGLLEGQRKIMLTFKQIEKILKTALPSSAYEDDRWWMHETEGNHLNTRAWANAGWKIGSVDVKKKRVTFIRETK